MTYRTAAAHTELQAAPDRDRDLVPFGAACPWCGHNGGHPTHYVTLNELHKHEARRLVRERTWSFLWWRSWPAHFARTCAHCNGAYRELTREME